jgi:RNA polymerase sigma-70 factor, ECF subfamily
LLKIVQIGFTEAAADFVNVEPDVIGPLWLADAEEKCPEIAAGGATEPVPSPDFADAVPALIALADQGRHTLPQDCRFAQRQFDRGCPLVRQKLVQIAGQFDIGEHVRSITLRADFGIPTGSWGFDCESPQGVDAPRSPESRNVSVSYPDFHRCGVVPCEMTGHSVIDDVSTAALPRIDWAEQIERHAPWLRTVVRGRLGGWNDVDDVMQELSARVFGAARRPRTELEAAPWLYRITVRLCLTRRRSSGRQKNFLRRWMASMQTPRRQAGDLLEHFSEIEQAARLRSAIDQLPQIERDVFLLKHAHHWTYQAIAEHLGCTVHTVEHRLLKARRLLRALLAPPGMKGDD